MGNKLPATFNAANDSLLAAGEAAKSLESAIKSLDTFRAVMSATPLISAFVPPGSKPYNPDKPLADSLGSLAASLQDMPATFKQISTDMDKADDNLALIKSNLETMSTNVGLISTSLGEYQKMISQSNASMENLKGLLANLQNNLERILTIATVALGLFFLWLLAAQVVIFSQGWELYHGTAGRMDDAPDTVPTTVVS
jgi:methyl-accepting chemotaxis protein